jgi:hypothetical protein
MAAPFDALPRLTPASPRAHRWLANWGRLVIAAVFASGCSAALDPAAIGDAQTAARVKTALVNDPTVGELAIEVRVAHGVTTLSGRVRSQEQAARAVDLARSVQGVTRVESLLQVGGESAAPTVPEPGGAQGRDFPELDSAPGLLAIGGSFGWSIPGPEALKRRASISPLIKLGSPRGFGPTLGLDWFRADLESVGGTATLTRVNIRPIMAGIGYAFAGDRISLTPSVVAGYSFNSLTVTDTGTAQGLPVEVGNSFVWRVGVSAWFDTSRRTAVNVSSGYVITGLRLTILEAGRLTKRDARGDTTILHLGVAYRLF